MVEVIMPKMGDGMEEGVIIRWLKQEGDPVEDGETIAEIGTDKANVELPASGSGVLGGVRFKEGDTVPVGQAMAYILASDEAPPKADAAPVVEAKKEPDPVVEVAEKPTIRENDRIKASPLAKKLASASGVSLKEIAGSGPHGRIVQRDVLAAQSIVPSKAPVSTAEPIPYLRKLIAQRMTEAKQTIPHFYLTIEVEMDAALALRKQLNEVEDAPKVSVNDLVVKACALALEKHPNIYAQIKDDQLAHPPSIDIGSAVAVPNGLLVAVVKSCEKKSLRQIAAESRALAEKARDGKLMPDEMSGNVFTVSNLGMFGIDEFSAIINSPATAILAVGATKKTPVVLEDDSIVVRQMMKLTLSCDHRTIDGASGAMFLQDVKQNLEQAIRLVG